MNDEREPNFEKCSVDLVSQMPKVEFTRRLNNE